MRYPQCLLDGLLLVARKGVFLDILEESLDGLAEGILVYLYKEWPLNIVFNVSLVMLAVCLVDGADCSDGLLIGWMIGALNVLAVCDYIGADQ